MIDLEDPFSDDSPTVVSNAVPVSKQGAAVIRHGEAEARGLTEPVTLIDVDVQNFRRIEKATIKFEELGVTSLIGKNRAGKTSILKAIKVLVGGKSFVPESPVHDDDAESTIVGSIKDADGKVYQLRRVVQRNRDCTIDITRMDGTPVERPQEFLSSLAGKNWSNPLSIMNAKPEEMLRMVKEWLGLDLSELDDKEKALYEERTIIGRERDRLKGHAAKLKLQYSPGVPEDEQTATELKAQWNAAVAVNTENAAKRGKLQKAELHLAALKSEPNSLRDAAKAETRRLTSEKTSLEAQIKALQERLKECAAELKSVDTKCAADCKVADVAVAEFEKRLAGFKSEWGDIVDVDTDTIATAMDDIEEINVKVRLNKAWKEAADAEKAEDAVYDAKTVDIEAVRAERKRVIAAAMAEGQKIIPELHFDESGMNLYYGQYPYSEAAESERFKVSIILSFAMDAAGLKIGIIDNAEALDEENTSLLNDIAKTIGVQLFSASVSNAKESDTSYIVTEGTAIPPKKK